MPGRRTPLNGGSVRLQEASVDRSPVLKIRFSPPASLDISAPLSELGALRNAVLELASGNVGSIELPADTDFDPHPYAACLAPLRVTLSTGRVRVAVAADGGVQISGSPANLEVFATFLDLRSGLTQSLRVL